MARVLTEQVQTGIIILETSSFASTTQLYFANFSKLVQETPIPTELIFEPMVLVLPGQGKTFAISYLWCGASTAEEQDWRARVTALAPTTAVLIATATPSQMIATMTPKTPPGAHLGAAQMVSLRGLARLPDTVDKLARAIETLPDDDLGRALVVHPLYGRSTTPPFPEGVFRNREVHFMVEILGFGVEKARAAAGKAWADETLRLLRTAGDAMDATYISLTGRENLDLRRVYGDETLAWLRRLKAERDPENVFRFAVPQLA